VAFGGPNRLTSPTHRFTLGPTRTPTEQRKRSTRCHDEEPPGSRQTVAIEGSTEVPRVRTLEAESPNRDDEERDPGGRLLSPGRVRAPAPRNLGAGAAAAWASRLLPLSPHSPLVGDAGRSGWTQTGSWQVIQLDERPWIRPMATRSAHCLTPPCPISRPSRRG